MVDNQDHRAGGLVQQADVRQHAAHVVGRVLIRAGRDLRQRVYHDHLRRADVLNLGDHLGDVLRVQKVRGGGDHLHVPRVAQVEVVVLGVRLTTLADARAALCGDRDDEALLGAPSAPVLAPRNRECDVEGDERLARA